MSSEPVELAWQNEFAGSAEIFSALSHPLRIAICHCLIRHPHTVGELHACLNISQPLASHHLKILRDAHIVISQQQGRKVLYSLTDEHVKHTVMDVHEHTKEHRL